MGIDEIRERKLRELQEQMRRAREEEEIREQLQVQKKLLMKQILTSKARSRLSNLRMAKPEFVNGIELQLIQLVRSGKVKVPITDEQLVKLLQQVQRRKKSISIRRK